MYVVYSILKQKRRQQQKEQKNRKVNEKWKIKTKRMLNT